MKLVSSTYNKPKGATVIKSIKAKKIHKEIKYQDLKGNFLAIIKNKKDEKYLLKNTGFTKEAAANNGIEKCKENFPNVLDLDNNEDQVEDDTVLLEDESDIDPAVDVGIKPPEECEEQF